MRTTQDATMRLTKQVKAIVEEINRLRAMGPDTTTPYGELAVVAGIMEKGDRYIAFQHDMQKALDATAAMARMAGDEDLARETATRFVEAHTGKPGPRAHLRLQVTAQELAAEAEKLFAESGSLDDVAAMLERYEKQGVPRATVVAAMGLIDEFLQQRRD